MSANLANNANGTAAFISLREIPWHRQGVVVHEEMSGPDFLEAAGLDFEVQKVPLHASVRRGAKRVFSGMDGDKPVYSLEGGEVLDVQHNQVGVYRADTGAMFGSAVGADFEVYQNREIISFFEGLVKERKIVYECAGALGAGDEVWVLANIPELNMAIRGDDMRSYMLIRNGHCGNVSLQCFPTTVRVVCANTMASARTQRRENGKFGTIAGGYTIRHTRNMREAVANVQNAYNKVLSDFVYQKEMYEFLASKPITDANRQDFFAWAAMEGRDEKKVAQSLAKQRDGISLTRGEKTTLSRITGTIDSLERLFESETNQQPGTRNTAFSLLQSVIEYADHERSTRCGVTDDCSAKRFESATFGSGNKLKIAALERVLEMVA